MSVGRVYSPPFALSLSKGDMSCFDKLSTNGVTNAHDLHTFVGKGDSPHIFPALSSVVRRGQGREVFSVSFLQTCRLSGTKKEDGYFSNRFLISEKLYQY